MNRIIDAALHRSRTTLSFLFLIIITGIVSYITLPREADPDVSFPMIMVQVFHEGISPEDGERLIIRPLETHLRSIEGVKEITATGAQSVAYIQLEFDAGFDSDKAMLDVREKIDLAQRDLPQDSEEPIITEFNASLQPAISVMMYGNLPERQLLQLARRLQDDIEGNPHVLEASISGIREEVLEIVIDPVRLEGYGISAVELLNAVGRNNRLITAGSLELDQGSFAVKVPGLLETASDVYGLAIKTNGDAVVTLRDVADIRRTFKDPSGFARFDGYPAVGIQVIKRRGHNIIETTEGVRQIVAESSLSWPDGVYYDYNNDVSRFIGGMLSDLQANITTAVLLVMIIVVAALGLRSAGLVGMAIPGSFLFTLMCMSVIGLTINMMTLFAMVLAVGMLVDGGIVVVELADRKMAEGMSSRDAYGMAAKRMAWPIIASTLTTIAAFLPAVFWPDVTGQFMRILPMTLIIVLSGSLLMALIFIPTLGALFGKSVSRATGTLRALAATEHGDLTQLSGLTGWYTRLITRLTEMPLRVIAVSIILMGSILTYYVYNDNGIEFFVDVEPDSGLVFIQARGNLSAAEESDLVRQVEEIVYTTDGIKTAFTSTGGGRGGGGMFGADRPSDVIGQIIVEFEDWDKRPSAEEIVRQIRERGSELAGIQVEFFMFENGPPTGKDIQLEFRTLSPGTIPPVLRQVREYMETSVSDIIDIEDSRPLPGIEWQLEVDRTRAGQFGVDVSSIGSMVQLVTNGIKVGEYRPNDSEDEIDIRVRFPEDARSIEQLDKLSIQTAKGLVPIANFVRKVPKNRVDTIARVDGKRKMTMSANVLPNVLPLEKVAEIREWIQSASLDDRVEIRFRGSDEEANEAATFLIGAFGVALFLMAIILVTQFNSFYRALLILFSITMSTVGVTVGLIVTGQRFSIVITGVGLMALAGIIVNNNIVLIDNYQRLRDEGIAAIEAIIRTGAQRLRPVLLTTVTTICGLLPMALQISINFWNREITYGAPSTDWWYQMATAIIFGLAFGTLMTLIFTPCALAVPVRFREWIDRRQLRRAGTADAKGRAAMPAE